MSTFVDLGRLGRVQEAPFARDADYAVKKILSEVKSFAERWTGHEMPRERALKIMHLLENIYNTLHGLPPTAIQQVKMMLRPLIYETIQTEVLPRNIGAATLLLHMFSSPDAFRDTVRFLMHEMLEGGTGYNIGDIVKIMQLQHYLF